MNKPFHIIVAHDNQRGIGVNNTLPWHCPADMAYFKATTCNAPQGNQNVVIMGRHTWESIPEKYRPLPGRHNIVLSRSVSQIENAHVAASLDQALTLATELSPTGQVFVIGGSQVYQQAIAHPQCDTLYVTRIYNTFTCDDFFPEYKPQFKCTFASSGRIQKGVNCAFFKYRRQN